MLSPSWSTVPAMNIEASTVTHQSAWSSGSPSASSSQPISPPASEHELSPGWVRRDAEAPNSTELCPTPPLTPARSRSWSIGNSTCQTKTPMLTAISSTVISGKRPAGRLSLNGIRAAKRSY